MTRLWHCNGREALYPSRLPPPTSCLPLPTSRIPHLPPPTSHLLPCSCASRVAPGSQQAGSDRGAVGGLTYILTEPNLTYLRSKPTVDEVPWEVFEVFLKKIFKRSK